jgi:hypothetical protein
VKRFHEPDAVNGAGRAADADDEWGRHANQDERADAKMNGRTIAQASADRPNSNRRNSLDGRLIVPLFRNVSFCESESLARTKPC